MAWKLRIRLCADCEKIQFVIFAYKDFNTLSSNAFIALKNLATLNTPVFTCKGGEDYSRIYGTVIEVRFSVLLLFSQMC